MIDTLDPFDGRPYRHRVGVRPLDPAAWLVVDDRAADDIAEKQRLLATARDDVCGAIRGSGDACEELLDALVENMRTYCPAWWRERLRAADPSRPAIEQCGLLTQEDWCLLQGDPPILTAGCVCFPNRWRVTANLGRPMRGIHGPVPRYDAQLGNPADQALARITPDRPVWRLNWSLGDDPQLHRPDPEDDPVRRRCARHDVARLVFLRQERQTLVRLPVTGAIVFGIRTFVRPLGEALPTPERRAQAAVVLRTLPDDVAAYKGVSDLLGPALAWLEAR